MSIFGSPFVVTLKATKEDPWRENGETLTTDGPFAETKEWLGGYYKIDVESLDEALEWAAKIPSVKHGDRVEVRPVMSLPADYATGS
jgi:hypothetical protein